MSVLKHLFFLVSLLCSPSWLLAANPSINELNSCFALVDFVDSKLDEFAGNYAKEDVLAVHAGLSAYGGFLQNDMIKPKLLNMYGGNEAQAKLMQALFDRQKASFYKTLNGRYTEKKLFTEYAAGINDCRANVGIPPAIAKTLNTAINTMIKMARQRP